MNDERISRFMQRYNISAIAGCCKTAITTDEFLEGYMPFLIKYFAGRILFDPRYCVNVDQQMFWFQENVGKLAVTKDYISRAGRIKRQNGKTTFTNIPMIYTNFS